MREAMGEKIKKAAFIALVGADISLLACMLIGAGSAWIAGLPLYVFVLFTGLYFVLDSLPQIAKKKWLKPSILAGVGLVIVVISAVVQFVT